MKILFTLLSIDCGNTMYLNSAKRLISEILTQTNHDVLLSTNNVLAALVVLSSVAAVGTVTTPEKLGELVGANPARIAPTVDLYALLAPAGCTKTTTLSDSEVNSSSSNTCFNIAISI